MEKLYVVKIGGNVIDDEGKLKSFLLDFSHIRGNKILVHGGGKIASELSLKLGIEPKMVKGRRVTDAETLKVITMVYSGLINKKTVALLQSNNCNAIGISGPDANIIEATKRAALGGTDYGYAGDVKNVQSPVLKTFIELGLTPVLAPVSHDKKGNLLNTNADTIAAEVAVAMANFYQVHLIYCFDKKGVLKDLNDDNSIIPLLDSENYQLLKQQEIIAEGMVPKLDNSFDALKRGVKSIKICSSDKLLNLLNSPEVVGTEVCV